MEADHQKIADRKARAEHALLALRKKTLETAEAYREAQIDREKYDELLDGLKRELIVVATSKESEANLKMFDIPYERGDDFLPNTPSLWVHTRHLGLVDQSGIQRMTLPSMLTYHLAHVLKDHAGQFLGVQEAMFLMNQMEKNFAELVREATRALPIITITDVLKRLVGEGISIRDMRTILEALVEWGQREKDPILLSEHVRGALSRYITYKYSGGQNVIPAYLLGKEVEDEVRGAVRQTSAASYLALSPEFHRRLMEALKASIHPKTGRPRC